MRLWEYSSLSIFSMSKSKSIYISVLWHDSTLISSAYFRSFSLFLSHFFCLSCEMIHHHDWWRWKHMVWWLIQKGTPQLKRKWKRSNAEENKASICIYWYFFYPGMADFIFCWSDNFSIAYLVHMLTFWIMHTEVMYVLLQSYHFDEKHLMWLTIGYIRDMKGILHERGIYIYINLKLILCV